VETWENIFSEMKTQTEGIHGWKTGYEDLDSMLDGIARPGKGGVAYGIAGAPQHGKSAAMLNIALRVAQNNDDVSVLYWAIDDSRKSIAYRLISIMSGVSIKKVRRMYTPNEEEELAILKAQRELLDLCSNGKLIFKDDKFGRSKSRAEAWIKSAQDVYERDIFFCVDSLHNVSGGQDMRSKLIESSTWLKSLCTRVPLSAMATLELVKNRGFEKPNLTAISETAKIEFDFDAVAVAWNEAQGKYGDLDMVSAKWGEPDNWKPIIELDWQKNKSAAGEKGPIYFKFDPSTTAFLGGERKVEGLTVSKPTISMLGETTLVIESEKDRLGALVPEEAEITLRTS
jgi:replicative DNA helicase